MTLSPAVLKPYREMSTPALEAWLKNAPRTYGENSPQEQAIRLVLIERQLAEKRAA